MSTLSEHTGNGNPIATRLQQEETNEQIDGVLQNFDLLPSRFDRCIFKYIYVYLLGLFVPAELLLLLFFLGISPQLQVQVGGVLLRGGLSVLSVVVFLLVIWPFNVWRWSTPKMLRDLFEQKRISLPDGDANASYLRFLEHYRDALASRKRYFLSGFPMTILGILSAYAIVTILSVEHPISFVTTLVVVSILLLTLEILGGLYCIGIVIWTVHISGWYIRKLVQAFALRIEPFHSDQCGGLKVLGNFCFGLVSPILFSSGLAIGFILLSLSESRINAFLLALRVGFPLLLILLYALPVIVLAFLLPLWEIHTKMVSEGETDGNSHSARIQTLREEIKALLAANQVEEAKAVQEKKALVETLYTPYPTWPFRVRSKLFSTVLGVGGSLLLGVMTASLQQYLLPAILIPLFHNP